MKPMLCHIKASITLFHRAKKLNSSQRPLRRSFLRKRNQQAPLKDLFLFRSLILVSVASWATPLLINDSGHCFNTWVHEVVQLWECWQGKQWSAPAHRLYTVLCSWSILLWALSTPAHMHGHQTALVLTDWTHYYHMHASPGLRIFSSSSH